MSGGGNNTNPTAGATPAPAAQPANQAVSMQNYPAFQPGQLGLLADQMAQGYGGTKEGNMGILNQMYKPVSMPIINKPSDIEAYLKKMGIAPAKPATAAAAKPGAVAGQPRSKGAPPQSSSGYGYSG